jgi:citrate lyase subunit gamma (acyl carrier protein)
MSPKNAAQAGTFESSDVIFLIEPLPENSGRKIELFSTVLHQYGESFSRIVSEMLDQYELTDIHLIARDKGALEPTIKARLETAINRSLGIQQGTLI